ncbi:MAG: tRNA (guanine-N(7)-)-methyltransferase [Pirellulaceae bacterium]|nr:MAG: tRNA (guanine-N(7)-)-methyltransferase [Pirellulaceae bacterium]
MRRKSLRAIREQYDLSGYLVELEQLPRPLVPSQYFGQERPFELEIGSGKGLFLSQAAAATPEHWFLGVEISLRYAMYTALRLLKAQVANARVVHGDAQRLVADYLPDAVVWQLHIYFPDPWWKKRHHKRRLMTPAFAQQLQRVLAPGGELHFWTDVAEYFQAARDMIEQSTRLEPLPVELDESGETFRTHFERRTRLEGRTVYRARFRRS